MIGRFESKRQRHPGQRLLARGHDFRGVKVHPIRPLRGNTRKPPIPLAVLVHLPGVPPVYTSGQARPIQFPGHGPAEILQIGRGASVQEGDGIAQHVVADMLQFVHHRVGAVGGSSFRTLFCDPLRIAPAPSVPAPFRRIRPPSQRGAPGRPAISTRDATVKLERVRRVRQGLGDETLRDIARELVETARSNVTIDWTLRKNVRANLPPREARVTQAWLPA